MATQEAFLLKPLNGRVDLAVRRFPAQLVNGVPLESCTVYLFA